MYLSTQYYFILQRFPSNFFKVAICLLNRYALIGNR